MTITELKTLVFKNALEKGFHDRWINNQDNSIEAKNEMISAKLMLIVSELGEALEALRKGNLTKNINNFTNFETEIKDTFEDEIADTIIRLLDLCGLLQIDIEKHIIAKMEYNKTRERLHGKKF